MGRMEHVWTVMCSIYTQYNFLIVYQFSDFLLKLLSVIYIHLQKASQDFGTKYTIGAMQYVREEKVLALDGWPLSVHVPIYIVCESESIIIISEFVYVHS